MGVLVRDQVTTCLQTSLSKATLKVVNCGKKKIQEVIQDKHQNLSQFLDHLIKALLQYTNLDPETSDGKQLPKTYFSQHLLDIRA